MSFVCLETCTTGLFFPLHLVTTEKAPWVAVISCLEISEEMCQEYIKHTCPVSCSHHLRLFAEIVDQPGLDVFGQVYNQWKNKECVCPNCSRSIAASRFAPHLEKCLGMGRNSSRIANRR